MIDQWRHLLGQPQSGYFGLILIAIMLLCVSATGCGAQQEAQNLQGLSRKQAIERAADGRFKLKIEYQDKRKSGNEVVINQYPFPGNTINTGSTVKAQLADREFQNALATAETQIQVAEQELQMCQHFGIGVDDLETDLVKARSLYNEATSIEQLVGPSGSTYYANTTIAACRQRSVERKQ